MFADADNRTRGSPRARRVRRVRGRRGARLQPRLRHGRHGVHREPQGGVHAVGADQHAPAAGRGGGRCRAVLLRLVGVRLRRGAPDLARRHPAARGGRLPGRCPRTATAGRSCSASGCAVTSPRTSASRRAWPATTTSTARTGPSRAAGRRPRPRSAARSPRRSCSAAARSRSGATASRRAASPTSTTASTGRWRSWTPTSPSRVNLGSATLVTIDDLVSHRRGDRRASPSSGATRRTRRPACGAATATTRS